MMTCVGLSGCDDIHWHKSCITPLRTSTSESELSSARRVNYLASRGCCDRVFLGGHSLVKSLSLARGGVLTMTPWEISTMTRVPADVCSLCW
jgi:hypothetical protein